jgi:hypothetical protein
MCSSSAVRASIFGIPPAEIRRVRGTSLTTSCSTSKHDDGENESDERPPLLVLRSNFRIEVDPSDQAHVPLFGTFMERLWRVRGFPAVSVMLLASCLVLISLQQPRDLTWLLICAGDVFVISIVGSALIDLRIIKALLQTFEFCFLQVLAVESTDIDLLILLGH